MAHLVGEVELCSLVMTSGTDLLDRALRSIAPTELVSAPRDEPCVRRIGSLGVVFADIDERGRLTIQTISDRFSDDWGNKSQRLWTVDPGEEEEILEAVESALDALRP
jgi:hypothetical protein